MKSKQIDLPGCAPKPLRFADGSCENGDGQALQLCKPCGGSGCMCSGKKTTFDRRTGDPTTETANFPGSEYQKRHRGGWDITSTKCSKCRGAGLVVEGGK